MVNGAEHGLETRRIYFEKATGLGHELMAPVDPDNPSWSDLMTQDELNKYIDGRLRALMFGNDELHKSAPRVYAKDGGGLDDRLRDHNNRLKEQNKRLRALERVADHPPVPTA
jgi:hypothetical protein